MAVWAVLLLEPPWETRILEKVNEVWFVRIYQSVLTLVALRLALAEIPALLGI